MIEESYATFPDHRASRSGLEVTQLFVILYTIDGTSTRTRVAIEGKLAPPSCQKVDLLLVAVGFIDWLSSMAIVSSECGSRRKTVVVILSAIQGTIALARLRSSRKQTSSTQLPEDAAAVLALIDWLSSTTIISSECR